MEKGDTVVCVDISDSRRSDRKLKHLTVGREYRLGKVYGREYAQVKQDNGTSYNHSLSRFILKAAQSQHGNVQRR